MQNLKKCLLNSTWTVEQIKTALGGTAVLENDLRFQKTVEFLVENAKIS